MLNLLLISNSKCAEALRDCFQQTLSIRVDSSADFDLGLKDVFEKRPFIVCVQENIDGVTGESVARHIQLLLGNKAPNFILMHNNNSELKPVPGLFEYLLDTNAPFDSVCQEFGLILRTLFGKQWSSIYSPMPGMDLFFQEDEAAAQSLIEDELKKNSEPPSVQSSSAMVQNVDGLTDVVPMLDDAVLNNYSNAAKTGDFDSMESANQESMVSFQQTTLSVAEFDEQGKRGKRSGFNDNTLVVIPDDIASAKVDDLLLDFEKNYNKGKSSTKYILFIVITVLSFITIVLYLASGKKTGGKLLLFNKSIKQETAPMHNSTVDNVGKISKNTAVSEMSSRPMSFIPAGSVDASFAKSKPGWTRYLTSSRDYRLYHSNGQLLAVQVLSYGNHIVSEQEMKQVLNEVEGNHAYKVLREDNKDGVIVERGEFSSGTELLVYRLTRKGDIKAFVIAPRKRGK